MMRKKWFLGILFLLVAGFLFLFFNYPFWVRALTQSFTQTDWSGGSDGGVTIDDEYLTGWTKYASKDDGVETEIEGEVRLKLEVSQP